MKIGRRQFLSAGVPLVGLPILSTTLLARQAKPQQLPFPPAGADGWISLMNGRNLDGLYTMLQRSGKGVAETKGMECQIQGGDVCDYFLLGGTRAAQSGGNRGGGAGAGSGRATGAPGAASPAGATATAPTAAAAPGSQAAAGASAPGRASAAAVEPTGGRKLRDQGGISRFPEAGTSSKSSCKAIVPLTFSTASRSTASRRFSSPIRRIPDGSFLWLVARSPSRLSTPKFGIDGSRSSPSRCGCLAAEHQAKDEVL